jgi:hypothetical protein
MKSQQGIQPTKRQAPSSPTFVEAEKLFERMKEFSQSVARRTYEYFEARGRQFGHDLEDWFRAESELMRRVPVEPVLPRAEAARGSRAGQNDGCIEGRRPRTRVQKSRRK